MEERPSSPASPSPTDAIGDIVAVLGRAVRRELRRTLLGLVAGLVSVILLLVVGLGFVVAGVMRLSEALGRACGQWFGDQVLGDVAVGLLLIAVPLVGVLILRLRSWR